MTDKAQFHLHRSSRCRICSGSSLFMYLDLGDQPPSNTFIAPEDVAGEQAFPLQVYLCTDCGLSQLLDIVSEEDIFDDYLYLSSTSKALLNHYAGLVSGAIESFRPADDSLMVDIGCNDGVMLKGYPEGRFRLLGIEPSSAGKYAIEAGFEVEEAFFNGRGAEYPALEAICKEHGLVLISDSAGALGSCHGGRALGSHGIAGCYSFSGNKTFFAGQGGAVVTDDNAVFGRLKDLRNQGRRESGPRDDVLHPVVGFNFKYPSLMAAVVLAQLEEMDERLDHVRTRDAWYRELLADCPEISFPGVPVQEEEACLWADVYVDDRDRLMDAFEDAGIGFRRFFLPLHRQDPYRQPDDAFPSAVESWEKGLWLPSALSLTRDQAERVAEICRKTFS